MRNLNVLIVDSNPQFHKNLGMLLHRFCALSKALSVTELRAKLDHPEDYDLVLINLAISENRPSVGVKLIGEIKTTLPKTAILVFFDPNNEEPYLVEADRQGASDFISRIDLKPEVLLQKIEEVTSRPTPSPASPSTSIDFGDDIHQPYPFIGHSPKIIEFRRRLVKLGKMDRVNLLITGETGTGKEVAARYFHRKSPRAHQPFVGVNLSAFPETLIDNELFGHKKGAYSGAEKDADGCFKQANGGVLLLDEIGDISKDLQVKLLRAIENRSIKPLGTTQDEAFDAHLITATHRNLEQAVAAGKFRLDLYQRIKTFTVELPALRDRRDDLLLLLQFLFQKKEPGAVVEKIFEKGALERLLAYPWPGNIRELSEAFTFIHFRWKEEVETPTIGIECLTDELKRFNPDRLLHTVPDLPATNFEDSIGSENPNPITPQRVAAPGQPTVNFKTLTEKKIYQELAEIEHFLQFFNGIKSDVAIKLEYKSPDSLRYKIKTCYEKYPQLFAHFPRIRKEYDTIIPKNE